MLSIVVCSKQVNISSFDMHQRVTMSWGLYDKSHLCSSHTHPFVSGSFSQHWGWVEWHLQLLHRPKKAPSISAPGGALKSGKAQGRNVVSFFCQKHQKACTLEWLSNSCLSSKLLQVWERVLLASFGYSKGSSNGMNAWSKIKVAWRKLPQNNRHFVQAWLFFFSLAEYHSDHGRITKESSKAPEGLGVKFWQRLLLVVCEMKIWWSSFFFQSGN